MTIPSAICFGLAAALAVWVFLVWRGFAQDWIPQELKTAKVVMVEQLLRVDAPFPIVGRLDRVYRLPAGDLVPMENKNRDTHRFYPDDIAQLSLQAWLLRRYGHRTADFGYVAVNSRETGKRKAIRLNLRDDRFCEELILRYLALTEKRAMPTKSVGPKCRSCGHRSRCQ